MAFMVARTEKRKIGSLSGYQNHVDRKTENHSNKDIDASKTYLNYDLVGHDGKTSFHEEFMGYINENRVGSRAVRKDAVVMQDWIIGSSQEFFDALNPEETRKYFETAVEFFAEKFGRENIRFATVHMDEKTPHMHMGIVPMKDGKLTAKTIFDRNCLRMIQNELPQAFQKAGFDIQRGEPKSEKVHLQPEEYKATMKAAQEKAKEITVQAKKEAETSRNELREQAFDIWAEDWRGTKANFPDFELTLDPFNWDFGMSNPALYLEQQETSEIKVDENTPRRFQFHFIEIKELFKVKYETLKEYIASKWRNLSRREAEIEKRSNTLAEKETSLESKLEGLKANIEVKDQEFKNLDKLINTKNQLIKALSEESDVSMKYPDYAKVNKFTGNVTVPKEKWEAKHVSSNSVNSALKLGETLSNIRASNKNAFEQRMELASLEQEVLTQKNRAERYANSFSVVYDSVENYEKVLDNLIEDGSVTLGEIKEASRDGQLLTDEFKIKQGLIEPAHIEPDIDLGLDKGMSMHF